MGLVEVLVLLLVIAIPLGAVLLVVRAISRRQDRWSERFPLRGSDAQVLRAIERSRRIGRGVYRVSWPSS